MIMYAAAMGNAITGGFSMPIGYLCQWISYAVFAAVSACCVPVSHADVLARFAFRAVCASHWRQLSASC